MCSKLYKFSTEVYSLIQIQIFYHLCPTPHVKLTVKNVQEAYRNAAFFFCSQQLISSMEEQLIPWVPEHTFNALWVGFKTQISIELHHCNKDKSSHVLYCNIKLKKRCTNLGKTVPPLLSAKSDILPMSLCRRALIICSTSAFPSPCP